MKLLKGLRAGTLYPIILKGADEVLRCSYSFGKLDRNIGGGPIRPGEAQASPKKEDEGLERVVNYRKYDRFHLKCTYN